MDHDYETLIVGGGPAGLAAALVLGRCLRKVLVCDAGRQRNLASHAIHALPGHEGLSPRAFLAAVRQDVGRYPSIAVCATQVLQVRRSDGGFWFTCSDGAEGTATTVLLTTGLVDNLPDIPNLRDFYGTSIHHCLYCDGAEHAGRPLIAYGDGDKAAALGLMMRHWSENVAVCSNGTMPGAALQQRLAEQGIVLIRTPIVKFVGEVGKLEMVVLADGTLRACEALFFSTGCTQGSTLLHELGCELDEHGVVMSDPDTEATSQPGVYAAGDITKDVLLVAVAIGEGAKAGVAINRALLKQTGLL